MVKVWKDGPGGGTPITASELNRIEGAIESKAAVDALNKVTNALEEKQYTGSVKLPWVYSGVSQTETWLCGPATVRNMMVTLGLGSVPTQEVLATEMGTTSSEGTKDPGKITRALNKYIPNGGYQRVQVSVLSGSAPGIEMERAWSNIVRSCDAGYPLASHVNLESGKFPTPLNETGTVETAHKGFTPVLHYWSVQGYKYLDDGRRLVFIVDSGWEPHGYYLELSEWWRVSTNKGYWWPAKAAGTGLSIIDSLDARFGAKVDRDEIGNPVSWSDVSSLLEANKVVQRKSNMALNSLNSFSAANQYDVATNGMLVSLIPELAGKSGNASLQVALEQRIATVVAAKFNVTAK